MARLPNTNINITLVKNALGYVSDKVSQLCHFSGINPWAKWKPVDSPSSVIPDWLNEDGFSYMGESGDCNMNVPSVTVNITSSYKAAEKAAAAVNTIKDKDYTYRVINGASRLGDFRGYDGSVRPQIRSNVRSDFENVYRGGNLTISLETFEDANAVPRHSIPAAGLFATAMVKNERNENYYFKSGVEGMSGTAGSRPIILPIANFGTNFGDTLSVDLILANRRYEANETEDFKTADDYIFKSIPSDTVYKKSFKIYVSESKFAFSIVGTIQKVQLAVQPLYSWPTDWKQISAGTGSNYLPFYESKPCLLLIVNIKNGSDSRVTIERDKIHIWDKSFNVAANTSEYRQCTFMYEYGGDSSYVSNQLNMIFNPNEELTMCLGFDDYGGIKQWGLTPEIGKNAYTQFELRYSSSPNMGGAWFKGIGQNFNIKYAGK